MFKSKNGASDHKSRKKWISNLLIIVGIAVAAYPAYELAYTKYWDSRLQTEIVSMDDAFDTLTTEPEEEDYSADEIAEAEEEALAGGSPSDGTDQTEVPQTTQPTTPSQPTAPATDKPSTTVKKPAPAAKSIGILTIPKINVKLAIVAGITNNNLKKGVAWMSNSGKFGENGNAVIAGHRGYTRGRLLNRLDEVEVGDTFSIKTKTETMNYSVYEIKVVLPTDTSVLSQPRSKEIVTLITCTPLKKSTHRLIVKAKRVE